MEAAGQEDESSPRGAKTPEFEVFLGEETSLALTKRPMFPSSWKTAHFEGFNQIKEIGPTELALMATGRQART